MAVHGGGAGRIHAKTAAAAGRARSARVTHEILQDQTEKMVGNFSNAKKN